MKIDAFAHALPVGYKEAFQKKLPRDAPKMSGGNWDQNKTLTDMDLRIAILDEFGIDMQVLLTPTPAMEWFFDASTGGTLARIANDGMAGLVERHPKRFMGVATVCLLDVEGAIAELKRSVRELKLRGVLLYSNIGGLPLDAPQFDDFYHAVEELAVPIWLHPARSEKQADFSTEDRSRYLLWQSFGWPYETTLAMARLVFSGVLKRHPGLRIIVHHAGAMVPFFAGRIRSFYSNPANLINLGLDPGVQTPYLDQFRDFYVDAWTNGSLAALMTSYEIFGADRMVFGSDMPFGAEMGRSFVREAVHTVERMMIPPTEREKIWSGNIRRLCGLERP